MIHIQTIPNFILDEDRSIWERIFAQVRRSKIHSRLTFGIFDLTYTYHYQKLLDGSVVRIVLISNSIDKIFMKGKRNRNVNELAIMASSKEFAEMVSTIWTIIS